MLFEIRRLALIALLAVPAAGEAVPAEPLPAAPKAASARLVEAVEGTTLRELLDEALSRNPEIAAAEARARGAAQVSPQVGALPDPVATLTAFLAPPETRTGPQRLAAGISQPLPWSGKLAAREKAAEAAAGALGAEVEAKRLAVITQVRTLYHELSFWERRREIAEEFLEHLLQHEEISRARYSTGIGQGQAVVKLQAEITRVQKELLDLETRRVELAARVNALRGRPAATQVAAEPLPEIVEVPLDRERLVGAALRARPELVAADARIAQADALVRLAESGYRPDFKVGLTYTVVVERDDLPGRLQPPPGNGHDIVGIQGGITLPVWRRKLAAAVEQALELKSAAEQEKRDAFVAIEAAIGDLTQRVPLSWRQLRLVEDLLIVQAEEALESAQAGYIAGTLNALDLLDAEHVLFDAYTAVARAKTDYLIGIARLEGALAGPLRTVATMGAS